MHPIVHGGVGSPQSIYDSSTTPYHRVGTRGYAPDGRVWYYAFNETTAALTKGELIVNSTVAANHIDQTVTAAADFTLGKVDVTFTVGATAIVLQEYVDGYVFITDSTGEGSYYQIAAHAGQAGSTTSAARLYSAVRVTTGAASTMSLVRNPYMNPQQSNTTVVEIPVGIPQVTLAAATTAATATAAVVGGTYGWLQTWGPCPVLADESFTTVGNAVTVGTGTAGAAEEDDTATTVSQEFIIGYNMTPFVDTEFQVVDLRIRA